MLQKVSSPNEGLIDFSKVSFLIMFSRRKRKEGIPMDPRDPRAKRTISPQVSRPVKTEPQTPEDFLFRTGPARIQQRRFAPAPFEMKPARDTGVPKTVIHPFADDVALEDEDGESDLVGIISDFT